MLQPTDRIDLLVWGLIGTDNSLAQEAEEEEIDGYEVFALGDFSPSVVLCCISEVCLSYVPYENFSVSVKQ